MHEKEINQFSSIFSDFTGINIHQLKDYLKSHNVSKIIDNPQSLTTDEDVLDKIEKLKRLKNLYNNMKSYNKEFKYGILQLRPNPENRFRRFTGLDELKKLENEIPNVSNYELIYIQTIDKRLTENDLSSIYEKFNSGELHPSDYYGHSISVSDVIVFSDGESHDAYFVDSFGFNKLDNFLSISMTNKIDYSMDVRKEYESLMNTLKVDSNDFYFLDRFKVIDELYSRIFERADKRADLQQENISDHDTRHCSCCKNEMDEGYCINAEGFDLGDEVYYCSDDCLLSVMTQEEYDELYEDGHAYWTQWESEAEAKFNDDLLEDIEEDEIGL